VFGLVPVRETAPGLLTFAMKNFGRRELESVRVAAALSGKGVAIRGAWAWGVGSDLRAKKRLEAKGRDDRAFISLFPSLAISVAKAFFLPCFPFPRPQPAAGA